MGLEADAVRVVEETIKELGGLDIIVSNAVFSPLHFLPDLFSSPFVSPFLIRSHRIASHRSTLTPPHPGLDALLLHPRPLGHAPLGLGHVLRGQRQSTELPAPQRAADLHRQPRGRLADHDVLDRRHRRRRQQPAVLRHQGGPDPDDALPGGHPGPQGQGQCRSAGPAAHGVGEQVPQGDHQGARGPRVFEESGELKTEMVREMIGG